MKTQLIIVGPTASGKTGLAVAAARRFNGEILSADSRQFYKGMDLGTGKDLDEFTKGGPAVPYHLIDIAEPHAPLNVHSYFQHYKVALDDVLGRDKMPILCGGSGLYIDTALGRNAWAGIPTNPEMRGELEALSKEELLERFAQLPAELQQRLDNSTEKRMVRGLEIAEFLKSNPEPTTELPKMNSVFVALDIPREIRRERITQRLEERFDAGLVEEVERLLESGVTPERLRYFGLEYHCVMDFMDLLCTFGEMFDRLETDIHRFAKRQMTWLRRMEKHGDKLHWVPFDLPREKQMDQIEDLLKTASQQG